MTIRWIRGAGSVGLLLLAAGCAAPVHKPSNAVFFPAPPELPRIQYLMSFSGSKDIEEQSAFNRFVVGEKQGIILGKPYGVGVYDGRVYVCDTNSTVVVFDFRDRTFTPLKGATGPGQLRQPINITIDADGTKYVTDPVRGQVVVFDRNDEYVRDYGMPGGWRPVDAVPFDGKLYVADVEKGLVKVFDLASGEMVKVIGDKGDATQKLDRPTNLAFDHEGNLYVTDATRFQVVKFDRDGHFLSTIGKAGDNLGHFARPKGIAFDRADRLYAVDAAFNNVQIFGKDGRILMYFGVPGTGPGSLTLPAKVTIDYDNVKYFQQYVQPGFEVEYLVFVTSQFGERLVNVLAFGKDAKRKYPSDEEIMKEIEARRKAELEKQQAQEQKQEPKKDENKDQK